MTQFPISLASQIDHDRPLPKAADVVVIGGGIIGVMTAWYLAKQALSVVLLEKGRIAGEQSSRNWGWIRQQGRDPAELPIMIDARRIWLGLETEMGEDLGLRQTGVTYLARSDKDIARYEDWLVFARKHGVDSRVVTPGEISTLIPNAVNGWAGGLTTPSDCRAEPWLAVPAMARAAVRAGVTILENCAARCLDITNGAVTGVMTEKGRINTPEVVLAGGAWSSLFARAHGVEFPQLCVRSNVLATHPMGGDFAGAAADHSLAFRRRQDGGFTLAAAGFHHLFLGPDALRNLGSFLPQLKADPFGTRYVPAAPKDYPDAWGTARRWASDTVSPFEKMRILSPRPHRRRLARLVRDFENTFPNLGPVRIRATWAGMIDTMPDIVPVIDRSNSIGGLTIATGTSGHGFGIGPAFGKIVANLVIGRETGHDLTRFRLSRFSDGSSVGPGPAL